MFLNVSKSLNYRNKVLYSYFSHWSYLNNFSQHYNCCLSIHLYQFCDICNFFVLELHVEGIWPLYRFLSCIFSCIIITFKELHSLLQVCSGTVNFTAVFSALPSCVLIMYKKYFASYLLFTGLAPLNCDLLEINSRGSSVSPKNYMKARSLLVFAKSSRYTQSWARWMHSETQRLFSWRYALLLPHYSYSSIY
jgi:hypothetical protein